MHHAVVYEMNAAAAPEIMIAKRRKLRVSSGLPTFQLVRTAKVHRNGDAQVLREVGCAPVLEEQSCNGEDRDGEQVVVEHGVSVLEAEALHAAAHEECVRGGDNAVAEHPRIANVPRRAILAELRYRLGVSCGRDHGGKDLSESFSRTSVTRKERVRTMSANDTKVKPVTDAPDMNFSPYACNIFSAGLG